MTGGVSGVQWVIGWTVGAAVVAVVAALLITIIALARQIRGKLVDVHAALVEARGQTAPLWELQAANHVLQDVLVSARESRTELGG